MAASELAYLSLEWWPVAAEERILSFVLTVEVVGLVVGTVVGAWHRDQVTQHSACSPPVTLHTALSLGPGGLGSMGLPALRIGEHEPPYPECLEQGQGRGRQPRLLISPWPPGDSEPQRQWGWHRSREVRGAQGRLRPSAAGGSGIQMLQVLVTGPWPVPPPSTYPRGQE